VDQWFVEGTNAILKRPGTAAVGSIYVQSNIKEWEGYVLRDQESDNGSKDKGNRVKKRISAVKTTINKSNTCKVLS